MSQDTRSADPEAYLFGPFTLDPRARRLMQHDAIVPLTTKAFDTLEVLVRTAGRTVTKAELLTQVWAGTFVQEETLTQNISTIRRALGDSAEAPRYVMTVPRDGYRFIAPVEILLPLAPDQPRQPIAIHGTATPARATRRQKPIYGLVALGGIAVAGIGLLAWSVFGPPSLRREDVSSTAFELLEPEGNRFSTSGGILALSPDGRYLTFLAADADGKDSLWVRPVDSVESTRIPGTTDASQPFWSADSRSIAFFSGGSLRRIDISGGPARTVCTLPDPRALAGSWTRGGVIVFALSGKGFFKVRAGGGAATPLIVPGMGDCQDCLWPSFLPDGRRFLFAVVSATPERGIYVGSIDGRKPHRILETASSAAYVEPGYVLYAFDGALVARRFDLRREQVGDDVVPVADRVWVNRGTGRAVFSASHTGLLAYREPQTSQLRWISRTGATLSTAPERIYDSFTISRDGGVLTSELDPMRSTYDLWHYASHWATATRLTFDPASDLRPLWSKDESAIVFARERADGWQLYEVRLERPGVERALLPRLSSDALGPVSWDGDVLEYATTRRGRASRLWSLRPGHDEAPRLLAEGSTSESEGRVSPDGRWLAFTTNVADSRVPQTALFVRPWHAGPGLEEIAAAGSAPRWRFDGRELFFIAPGGWLMAQQVRDGHRVGAPVALCPTDALATSGLAGQAYDAAPDGQRFLVKVPARRASIIVRSGVLPSPR